MFHVKDGLYFDRRREADYNEIADAIDIIVTQPKPELCVRDGVLLNDMGRVTQIIRINPCALASVMASMSRRGENAETHHEALQFLMRAPKEE